MLTFLVLEDKEKVSALLSNVLRKEGYAFIDEPQSGGIIKMIKKSPDAVEATLGERMFELKNLLLKEKDGILYKSLLEEIEKPLIGAVLERTEGNQLKAAKILGINRNTLRSKMKKLRIPIAKWKT